MYVVENSREMIMKILLAHDGSEQSEKALARAADLAGKLSAELTVVSVSPDLCLPSAELSTDECDVMAQAFDKEARGILKKVRESLASRGIEAKVLAESGRAAEKIVETAQSMGADLIVLGSRGKHGASRFFLGSVSGKVAEHAGCDVLIVK